MIHLNELIRIDDELRHIFPEYVKDEYDVGGSPDLVDIGGVIPVGRRAPKQEYRKCKS